MARTKKIDVPADLTSSFVVPEDASEADLRAMIDNARVEANKLVADDARGPVAERLSRAEWYIGAIDAMQERQTALAEAAQAEAEQIAAARERIGAPSGDGTDGEDDDETDDTTGDAQAQTDAAAAAGADATVSAGAPAAGTGVLVAGAGAPLNATAAAASRQRPPRVTRREGSESYITAAAGFGEFEAGQKIDWPGVGKAGASRFEHMPSRPGGPRSVQPIARVRTPTVDERLVAAASNRNEEFANIDEQLEWAMSAERLRKAQGAGAEQDLTSLVAAGGWCAPSETLYDLLDLTTAEGLIDVPGITVNRGGVRYSLGPDFTAVYNAGANFTKTEAQVIAASQKPVVNIPCPSFNEYRMLVDGMYFTGDILSAKGYPEAYADFTGKAMKGFQHYVSAATIADMVTASTAVDFTVGATKTGTKAVTTELLGAVELQITDMRYKNRLSLGNSVELVFPLWLKGALRSDLAKRTGYENALDVTDAMIENWFTERHANAQWVYDWQDAFTGVSGGFGGATAPLTWPTSASFLIYPTGTFARALNEVIELSAVYDSTLLKLNQYVALFIEQGRLTLKRGWDSRVCTIPVLPSGATAAGVDYTAYTAGLLV